MTTRPIQTSECRENKLLYKNSEFTQQPRQNHSMEASRHTTIQPHRTSYFLIHPTPTAYQYSYITPATPPTTYQYPYATPILPQYFHPSHTSLTTPPLWLNLARRALLA